MDVGRWFAGKQGYEELEELVRDIEGRIVLLHLHVIQFQDTFLRDHLPLGQGDVDFSRLFHILRRGGLQWKILEMQPTGPGYVSVARDLIAKTFGK